MENDIINYKLNDSQIRAAIFNYVCSEIEVPEGNLNLEFHWEKNKEKGLSCELIIKREVN